MATKLIDLIEDVTQDDLPTNIFTIEDEDPMVILGKLNEVIGWLKELQIDDVESVLEMIADIKQDIIDLEANKQDNLTQTQLDAVNSGIDSTKVAQIATNTSNISNIIDRVISLEYFKVNQMVYPNALYATDNEGMQTHVDYQVSQTDSANKIVQRDANRDVLVPSTPTSNNSATSKLYVNTYNMCPSDDNSLVVTTTPVSGNIYFTAPANGMAYLRFNVSWNGQNNIGTIDFNIIGTNNNYLMYFSQEYYDTNPHVYMVNIPLKKGQKIRCNNLSNININWGSMTFIKSEGQS